MSEVLKIYERDIIRVLKNKNIVLKNKTINFYNEITKTDHSFSYLLDKYFINNEIKLINCEIFIKSLNANYIDRNIELINCNIFLDTCKVNINDENMNQILNTCNKNHIFINSNYISGYNISTEDLNKFKNIISQSLFIKETITKNSIKPINIQDMYDVEYFNCKNGIMNNKISPCTKVSVLNNNSGSIDFYGKELHITGNEDLHINVKPNSDIIVEGKTRVTIDCTGSFNIYFKNNDVYKNSKITINSGTINKTNINNFSKRPKFNKFKFYINVDFTSDDFISQYYGCIFVNCCFNENQYIMDSKLRKCYFLNKNNNLDNCEIS